MLSLVMTAVLAAGAAGDTWHDQLSWHDEQARMTVAANGGFTLSGPFGHRDIGPQTMRVDTASTLFNGLFAMAQDDLKQDSVTAISDGAFDHGQPIPCTCFETGVKWPYVWTRDLSYSVDLGLWKIDPLRARNGLRFKLSDVRDASLPQGLYVMQDTGSGGSWPISTDRVVWFLAAQHLLDDKAFADDVYRAVVDTLDQDRLYTFDPDMGLYRGETSFLDWREQTYPAWTADNVAFIAQSFALSTNVLHYEALQLAARLAEAHGDKAKMKSYADKAAALKTAINARFWRADRGMYMSYIGGDGTPYDTYDLLGTALAITGGVADGDRARQALAHYPTWPAGSPVIWPERPDQPIYHNRAIWPFVSAYALRAARTVNDPARIEHELRSIMRGAALSGSNMENYELATQATHVDEGKLSGPVVDSPRQLWSVAAYLDAVSEGVFGLTQEGKVEPKLPVALMPMLFGDRDSITLQMPDRRITLRRPRTLHGDLLVAGKTTQHGDETIVTLKAIDTPSAPLRTDTPLYAPQPPAAPVITADDKGWRVEVDGKAVLYADGQRMGRIDGNTYISQGATPPCVSATRVGEQGVESLHSPIVCAGEPTRLTEGWPREWKVPVSGRYRIALSYENNHGPINTGVTAAVKMLVMHCDGSAAQRVPIVMPHSVGEQQSTYGTVTVKAGATCHFALEQGFNMSDLSHFAHFTGGKGGSDGPLNDARMGDLLIAPAAGTP
ncbi:MGH1-like glycoside hydrolase domain-containing protein [Dyella psychrodurans]|uniref:Six-hairpin glycosidase-like protein n=1 Tax=Dyella psychrodurans TaxID=1927960 RepID=A0A370WX36_9GAMM|nr:Six-hairpin glycosidase-like protein [Dyella psychrodurans]RDS80682.1 Six-hairpin glycosidase-like protein [Dyella psychrodurans]